MDSGRKKRRVVAGWSLETVEKLYSSIVHHGSTCITFVILVMGPSLGSTRAWSGAQLSLEGLVLTF